MPDSSQLRSVLQRIDSRSYPAYRDIAGQWRLGEIVVCIDHVQGDPFAAPSRLRLLADTGLDPQTCTDPDRKLAAEDWLLRRFGSQLHGKRRGSGKSGLLHAYKPGPEVVERSALRLHRDGTAEVRFWAGLPAQGRRVLGQQAWRLLTEDVCDAADVLWVKDRSELDAHIHAIREQRLLRRQLQEHGLVAFVGNGAILPRQSGVSQSPLPSAVPFVSPDSLSVTLKGLDGPVVGMGIKEGLTLIVGGGFHGKSTLLQAIQRGFVDHIPADGRGRVVCREDVVKVRAEDGRPVEGVDISPFLNSLPGNRSTAPFFTADASGSTSQAAAVMEAIEAGAGVLLLDEDTSATNLLVRDERMRTLIPSEWEPITPFVERVRDMHGKWGVSTIMVVGGVGAYLDVADTVIAMKAYRPEDVTERVRAMARTPLQASQPLGAIPPVRCLSRQSLLPAGRKGPRARDRRRISYGDQEIEVAAVEHVIDRAHAATMGLAVRWLAGDGRGQAAMDTMLRDVKRAMDERGVECLSSFEHPPGDLIRPRTLEIAAVMNRLRTLDVVPSNSKD